MTLVATAVALGAGITQFAVPAVVPWLERKSDGLFLGEWWRCVTPLLVQTLGLHQVVANLVTLFAVGVVAEQVVGRRMWLLLFVAGTVAGQVAAFVRHEPGGGSSIAICGLAGGTLVALLAGARPVPRLPALVVTCYIVALAGWGFRGPRTAVLATVLVAVCLTLAGRVARSGAATAGLVLAALCVVVLALVGDLHGVSLTAGAFVMVLRLAGPGSEPAPAARRGDPPWSAPP